jgi:DNA-binding LacI/PurR family transcriptional regulator
VFPVNSFIPGENITSIQCNDHAGIEQYTTHLIQKWHTKILFVNDNDMDNVKRKLGGYLFTMLQIGQQFYGQNIIYSQKSSKGGQAADEEILECFGCDFTAVAFAEDITAMGCIHTFTQNGIQIPRILQSLVSEIRCSASYLNMC